MFVYELFHLFYRFLDEVIISPKNLGLYATEVDIQAAKKIYLQQPGFRENPDGFSLRRRMVCGEIAEKTVYSADIYLHSEDYEEETDLELGLYGSLEDAKMAVADFCQENPALMQIKGLEVELPINRYTLGERLWPEGFTID